MNIRTLIAIVLTLASLDGCKDSDSDTGSKDSITIINDDMTQIEIEKDLIFQFDCRLQNLATGLYGKDFMGLTEGKIFAWSSYYSDAGCSKDSSKYSLNYAKSANIIEGNNQSGKVDGFKTIPSFSFVRSSEKLVLQIDDDNWIEMQKAIDVFSMPSVPKWSLQIIKSPTFENQKLELTVSTVPPTEVLVNGVPLFKNLLGKFSCIDKNSFSIDLMRPEDAQNSPGTDGDFPLGEAGDYILVSKPLSGYDIRLLERCQLSISSIYEKSIDGESTTTRSTIINEIEIPL
jgi:hypothetical protein